MAGFKKFRRDAVMKYPRFLIRHLKIFALILLRVLLGFCHICFT
jgi:hypothetical protein